MFKMNRQTDSFFRHTNYPMKYRNNFGNSSVFKIHMEVNKCEICIFKVFSTNLIVLKFVLNRLTFTVQ